MDRNLVNFPSIVRLDAIDSVEVTLEDRLSKYKDFICDCKVFDVTVLDEVSKNIDLIKKAWSEYNCKNESIAKKNIEKILNKYIKDDFFVSDLDKTYGIKQFAHHDLLADANFKDLMRNHEITLFRARESNQELQEVKDMLHRPYKADESIPMQRFTRNGMPALYLSTTSYAAWLEINKPDTFYAASFIPNEEGKKLKILNLVITEELINGIYKMEYEEAPRRKELQEKMLSFFPLVIATSFKYNCKNKNQYIIPELVMSCLKDFNIDGVSYLSKHLSHDLQLMLGVNIAIPVYKDQLIDNKYGNVVKFFEITKPVEFSQTKAKIYSKYKEGSYYSDIFCDDNPYQTHLEIDGVELNYQKKVFVSYDNYLVNQKHYTISDKDICEKGD